MKVIHSIQEMKAWRREQRAQGKTIGLVPTMGYLHEGHLTLMRQAKKQCDLVVASIFVNPIQFGVGEDYEDYPRDLSRDVALAEGANVDVIFAPAVADMYLQGFQTTIEVAEVSQPLCGQSRPGHFRGVATVVTKLLNIVAPDQAFFGQKDAQQAAVLQRMVADLNMDVSINVVPIVREADGLALSSRNVYLSPEERQAALVLSGSLKQAEDMVADGVVNVQEIRARVENLIAAEPMANIDYVQLLALPNLTEEAVLAERNLLAVAVRFGKTRLIDNIILEAAHV